MGVALRKTNMNKLLPICILTLCAMCACVQSSKSYAYSHPMDGMQLKMQYCIDMIDTAGVVADVGCKVGKGDGKVGVKKEIVRQVVERLNKHKYSDAYKMLVSSQGLKMTFKDESLGSKGDVMVWENDSTGRVKIQICREQ